MIVTAVLMELAMRVTTVIGMMDVHQDVNVDLVWFQMLTVPIVSSGNMNVEWKLFLLNVTKTNISTNAEHIATITIIVAIGIHMSAKFETVRIIIVNNDVNVSMDMNDPTKLVSVLLNAKRALQSAE